MTMNSFDSTISAWRNGRSLAFRVAFLINICLSSPPLHQGCSHLAHHIGWCSAARCRAAWQRATSGNWIPKRVHMFSHQLSCPTQMRMTQRLLHRNQSPACQGKSLWVMEMLLLFIPPGLSRAFTPDFLSLPASLSSLEHQHEKDHPRPSLATLELSKLHDLNQLQKLSLGHVPDSSPPNTRVKTAHWLPSMSSSPKHSVRELFIIRNVVAKVLHLMLLWPLLVIIIIYYTYIIILSLSLCLYVSLSLSLSPRSCWSQIALKTRPQIHPKVWTLHLRSSQP